MPTEVSVASAEAPMTDTDDTVAEPVVEETRLDKQGNLAHKCHGVGARARFVNVWSN
jgi:hypothetical protein